MAARPRDATGLARSPPAVRGALGRVNRSGAEVRDYLPLASGAPSAVASGTFPGVAGGSREPRHAMSGGRERGGACDGGQRYGGDRSPPAVHVPAVHGLNHPPPGKSPTGD